MCVCVQVCACERARQIEKELFLLVHKKELSHSIALSSGTNWNTSIAIFDSRAHANYGILRRAQAKNFSFELLPPVSPHLIVAAVAGAVKTFDITARGCARSDTLPSSL